MRASDRDTSIAGPPAKALAEHVLSRGVHTGRTACSQPEPNLAIPVLRRARVFAGAGCLQCYTTNGDW